MAKNRGVPFVTGAVLGAVAGVLILWALGRGAAGHVASAAPPHPAPRAAASPAPAVKPAVAAVPSAKASVDTALRACRTALAAAEGRAGRNNAQLNAENGKLAEANAIEAQDEGTPIEPPQGMPARFTDPKYVRKAVQGIFDKVGGGSVTSVDCTEFPCVVYGDMSRPKGKLYPASNRLMQAAIRANGWTVCDYGEWGMPKASRPTFGYGFAVCPAGLREKLTQAQRQRLEWRIAQMKKADLGN